mmetsp:Transcript_18145/g.28203  ORF Transcript_18145/g.28203 Transcript_18145/m.28203 type:complete len:867 (-) Transcript_18145:2198-4798(-)
MAVTAVHGSAHRPFQRNCHKLLCFHGKFHRQRLQHVLAEPVDDQGNRLFLVHPTRAAIEHLVVVHFGRRCLMLHPAAVILDLDIGHRVRPAFVTNQERVALRIVPRFLGLGMHRHQSAISVLRLARADPLGHDARFGALAQMDHLGAGVGLLHVVGDGNGVELALAVIAPQNTGRVFPRHSTAGLDLRPHHLGPVAPAIGAFGHKVIDAALPVLVPRIPVLNGGIFHFGVFFDDDFDHGGVQLRNVTLRRGAPFQIADIAAFVGDDQGPLELAGVFGIDAEIGRQFHGAAHAGWHVHKGPIGKHGRVQRRIIVVRDGHHGAQVLFHQFGVILDRLRDGAEDHTRFGQLILERCPHRNGVEHRIHSHLARRIGQVLGPFNTRKDHLLFQRNAKFRICFQQLGIDLVQRLGFDLHRFGTGIVILVLKIDLGIVDHRPFGLFLLQPPLIGRQTPLQHPLRLFVFFRDQLDDIGGQTLGGVLHLDIGFPSVFISAADLTYRVNGLLIDTVFDHHIIYDIVHIRHSSRNFAAQAARAWCFFNFCAHTSAKRMISSSVVSRPSDTRTALAATSPRPIASSTRLALTLPLEQAEPAEMAKPAKSICITCVSPFQPGVAKQDVLGRRDAPFPTKIVVFDAAARAVSRIFLSFSTSAHFPASTSRCAAAAAAPKPAIPITFSVPERRPISCPPPLICATTSRPCLITNAPTPLGPPSLCAETRPISQPSQSKPNGTFPKACVRSLSARPCGGDCITPVSELASCKAVVLGAPTLTNPSSDTGKPRSIQLATASCSIAAPTNSRPAQANAAASVALDTKTISAPAAPNASEIWARALSTMALAARPSACTDDGLPTTSIAAIIASRASARKGVVAL